MVDRQRHTPRDGDGGAADLGLLLLDANALTVPGAVSHPRSFGLSTAMLRVDGATAAAITSPTNGGDALRERYVEAATALANDGVSALTTNCGFTLPFQQALQQRTRLPVVSSSLLLLPALIDVYGSGFGVLTYDAVVLRRMLARSWSGLHADVPTADVQFSVAWDALRQDADTPVDIKAMRDDLVSAADAFVEQHRLTALLLECTGFTPFAEDLRAHLNRPVFDHVTIVRFLLGAPMQSGQSSPGGMRNE